LETSSSEQDRSLEILRAMFKRDKTYYNQTGEIRELLMENRTTGSQAQVSYWDGVQEAPVTMAAVCMGVEETGVHTISLQVGIKTRDTCGHCRAIKKH